MPLRGGCTVQNLEVSSPAAQVKRWRGNPARTGVTLPRVSCIVIKIEGGIYALCR